MALETKLVQKLSQSLLMTPQLQQAIKLLQLGRQEYIEAIHQELMENPVLEEIQEEGDKQKKKERDNSPQQQSNDESESPDTPLAKNEESPVAWEDYLESFSDYRGSATPRGTVDYEDRPSYEATLTKTESLQEYVISQLRLSDLTDEDYPIAVHVVGNLNKDGYLCTSSEDIAKNCSCDTERVDKVIEVIQTLDPPGLAARDLAECLLIQLELQGLGDRLASRIIRNHLEKLEKRKYDQIAKLEAVAVEEVYKAVQAIQQLEPRPGRPYGNETIRYITPDIYVYKVGSEYVISLNEDGLPKLRVSPYYLEILKDKSEEESRNYLNDRLKAASWLIKSIHQRQQTIYKVTESIVKFQREFFDHGISRLKPLVLKDVADDISMHESTVSRVTTNKYVHTPQGVFELKFFFSTGIKTASGEVSSSVIKERIKAFIEAEAPEQPISDQKIVELLKAENVTIARRTVAKYRESLGILSSSKRKKLF